MRTLECKNIPLFNRDDHLFFRGINQTILEGTGKELRGQPAEKRRRVFNLFCAKCQECLSRKDAPMPFSRNSDAKVVFIVRTPMRSDCARGEFFSNSECRTSQVFDQYLSRLGLVREQVYITSVARCYFGEEDFLDREYIRNCGKWLHAELSCLGNIGLVFPVGMNAVELFMGDKVEIREVAGKVYKTSGSKVWYIEPLIHPVHVLMDKSLRPMVLQSLQVGKKLVEHVMR